jgi:hypothetical protein
MKIVFCATRKTGFLMKNPAAVLPGSNYVHYGGLLFTTLKHT